MSGASCYKVLQISGKKGKVLPLFADNLNSEQIRPLEEAWLWQAFHLWVSVPAS